MTTDVAETTGTETSTAGTPPPTETPELVSKETAAPAPQGSETPEQGEPEPREADSYDLGELNQLYGQGKLDNPALVTRRESLITSAQQKWAFEQKQLADQRAADEQVLAERLSLKEDAKARLASERAKIMARPLDEETRDELLAERENAILEEYHSKSMDAALAPHIDRLRRALLMIHGDTARNRQAINARDMGELLEDIYTGAWDAGRKAGPDEQHVVMTKAELEKAKSDHLDEYKAANPLPGTVSTAGVAGSTFKPYSQMSPEERSALTPEQRDSMAAQYRS